MEFLSNKAKDTTFIISRRVGIRMIKAARDIASPNKACVNINIHTYEKITEAKFAVC
jgi:hypothetical protein